MTHGFRVNHFREETLAPEGAFAKSFYATLDPHQGELETLQAEVERLRIWVASIFSLQSPQAQLALLNKHGGSYPGEWILVQPTQGNP